MIDTVLFDFDGTLLNSNELIAQSHLHVLNHYYPDQYSREAVRLFNGPPLRSVYEQIDPERSDEMLARYRTFSHKHHDDWVSLFPGVIDTLISLRRSGKKIAIVSTKLNEILEQGLALFNLRDHVDVVIGGSDCLHHKPDPEPINKALLALNSQADTSVMVGDNWQDIASAHNAGVKSVFVGWSEKTLLDLRPHSPDYVVHSMTELGQWLQA
ncbi:MAG: pyrophosphatase PpaX [Neisseriaceae bacterium]|nr:pyrophosphatase PpaX [Neisseriaceae bacterium]MBP6863404.1 pyrophosphatase PpaX [Neisseriaceae bacterium]